MIELNQLPSFDDCQKYGANGTALQRFIYEHEPAGLADELRFRQGLVDLLNMWEAVTIAGLNQGGTSAVGCLAAVEATQHALELDELSASHGNRPFTAET